MSRGINKVIVVGNLGNDPDSRYIPSGACVVNMSVAVSESWKDKQTGEQKERTEWVKVEVWGNTAEACAQHLRKGSQVYVEGKMQTDKWQDRDGNDRWTTKVRADTVQFLGKPSGTRPAASDATDQDGMPPHSRTQQDEFEDDIPF